MALGIKQATLTEHLEMHRCNYGEITKLKKQNSVPLLDDDSRFYSPPALVNIPLCYNLF